ncbi:hypothetical protein TpMuguga_02g02175 [Theileria parva strain Muguga]|uniref:uncharacterized protein n=1 Tax=Theileria parva strain Muguga TaxID=333668 RepID=UPI001C624250|nr:uncharacterized protein TpMuguga_02g02175 [Theileria parva strain Muguga]KAF5153632.1 hypothetical protein TpMuguga_02g02175 [Theileria parva strain Muguga]
MNIVGRGEEVSKSVILSILNGSIERYKLLEDSGDKRQDSGIFEKRKKKPKDEKVNKNDLWNLKVSDLNEFSIKKSDSYENSTNQLKFLESVKYYITHNLP